MRLYPPAPIMSRQARVDSELAGVPIKAGHPDHHPDLRHSAPPAALDQSRPLRAQPLCTGGRGADPALSLHAVWCGTAHLHRNGLCPDRGYRHSRDACAGGKLWGRAGIRSRAHQPRHAPPGRRHAAVGAFALGRRRRGGCVGWVKCQGMGRSSAAPR